MTLDEAYNVLGIDKSAAFDQIQMVYRGRLKQLQLKLASCTNPSDRQATQDTIKRLVEAMGIVKDYLTNQNAIHPQTGSTAQTKMPPTRPTANRNSYQPQVSNPATQISFQSILIASVATVVLMSSMFILCRCSYSDYKSRSKAMLRVISVPWCEVEIDGKRLGPSGQSKAFEIVQGKHRLILRRGDKALTENIRLFKNKLTIITVQFDKGRINVKHN